MISGFQVFHKIKIIVNKKCLTVLDNHIQKHKISLKQPKSTQISYYYLIQTIHLLSHSLYLVIGGVHEVRL